MERVILGQGSLQLLDLIARLLLRPGDVVYTENPTYDRTLTILRRAGGHVVGIPLEADGPDVAWMEGRLRRGERPVFFYLIPDFQNPSGTVLSTEKRRRIVELAHTYGFWIIEDVPYRHLRYRGENPPAFFDLAPERVLRMSSYSKLISPGMRVGYIIAPEGVAAPLAKAAEDTYISPSYLTQAIILEFIRRGWMPAQIARLKALYEPRLDAALQALDAYMDDLATWTRPDGGFFIGVTIRGEVETDRLLAQARARGLLLSDGRGFFTEGGENFVRLPFCGLSPAELDEGVRRLAAAVRAL